MTQKGCDLSNQRAWTLTKKLGERAKVLYSLGWIKSRKQLQIEPDPFRESAEAQAQVSTGENWLSAKQLAAKHSLNPATLRRRLKKWREKPENDSGYIENDAARCRGTRIVYLERAVLPLLRSMRKRTSNCTSKKK